MATYLGFSDGPTNLRVEVETGTAGTGGAAPSLAGLVDAIRFMVSTAAQQVGQIPAEQRPTDLTISFGIRTLENGGFAIGLDESVANFRVTLAWTQEPGPAIPEVPALELPGETA